MINAIKKEYRLNRRTMTAKQSLNDARTSIAFATLEDCHLVRLNVVPDDSPDLSWLDQLDDKMGRGFERQAVYQRERANDFGCWGIVGQYRVMTDPRWFEVDSVWGFIDNDWQNSGYDIDIKRATMDALRTALKNRCPQCRKQ